MPKYRNITNFVKPLTIGGKRIIVRPNDIVFSERELDLSINDFLEKTDDKTPVSVVKEIVKKQITITKSEDVKQIKSSLDSVKKDISSLQTTPKDISDLNDKMNIILKRLESMKSAIEQVDATSQESLELNKILEKQVNELATEVYENGSIVITGLDEEEQTKG